MDLKSKRKKLKKSNIEEEEVEEGQQVAESSRAPSIAWLCFDKSTASTKNGNEYYVLRIFATRFSLYSQEPSIWSVTHC
jgi:hypothetical protein